MGMTFAVLDEDMVVGRIIGVGAGLPIPGKFSELPLNRLRFDGTDIIDADGIGSWLIDDLGRKRLRAMNDGSGWQALDCAFNDVMIKASGVSRLMPIG